MRSNLSELLSFGFIALQRCAQSVERVFVDIWTLKGLERISAPQLDLGEHFEGVGHD